MLSLLLACLVGEVITQAPLEICSFNDVEGPNNAPDFGTAIAYDGQQIFVTSPFVNQPSSIQGSVFIYDVLPSGIALAQEIENEANSILGLRMARSESRLAVSEFRDPYVLGVAWDVVRLYERVEDAWTQVATIGPIESITGASSIALDGRWLAVADGAVVQVYDLETSTVAPYATFVGPSAFEGPLVAIDGDRMVVQTDSQLRLFDLPSASLVDEVLVFGPSISAIDIAGDTVVACRSNFVLVYAIEDDQLAEPEFLNGPFGSWSIGEQVSIEGDRIVAGGKQGLVQVYVRKPEGWSLRKRVQIQTTGLSTVGGLLQSGSNVLLAYGEQVSLWDETSLCASTSLMGGRIVPASVPSVVFGNKFETLFVGSELLTVASVSVGGELLESFPSTWEVVGDKLLRFAMPPAPQLGIVPVTVTRASGSTSTANVRIVPAEPPVVEIGGGADPEILLTLLPTQVTFGGVPGDFHFFAASASPEPTEFPGVATFGLGAAGQQLIMLGSHEISAQGWATFSFSVNQLPLGTPFYFQSVAFNPATGVFPLPSSNVAVAEWLF